MDRQTKAALFTALILTFLLLVAQTRAHNAGYSVASLGKPASFTININGVDGAGEWTGATTFDIDYGMGDPLKGHVKALHKADGIYLQVQIEDATSNNDDTLLVMFDINHTGGSAVDADDFGVEVRRDPTNPPTSKKWGPATTTDHNLWLNMPDANAMRTSIAGDSFWTVEIFFPTGAPSGLAVGATIGIYFQIYDADNAFGSPSAKFTQWPKPPAASPDDVLDGTPNQWGNYVFDPASTFPNLTAFDVRRADAGAANYGIISTTATNRFDVQVSNPGGTAVADANPVRLNLYLAARGIGEPWHRLDALATTNGDCAAQGSWPWSVIPAAKVCSGAVALGDISTVPLASVNTSDYVIQQGVTRLDGGAVTVAGGTSNFFQVMTWTLTGGQDTYFTGLRAHQCMLAEVIFANDPNPADNLVQANMDFESVAPASGGGGGGGAGGAGGANEFAWRAGNAAFSNFNPAVGRNMFFEVDTKNMNRQDGWDFQLDGVQPLNAPNLFVARIAGKDSLQARLRLKAPAADVIGKTIKENLVVPPKAGGFQVNAKIPSGEPPVYVKVNGGTTLLIANYAFSAQDPQHVDLDGSRKLLPPNGPSGLPDSVLQSAVRSVGEKFKLLLVPTAPLGALVGSWDNFQTGFVIGDGVQVDVPPNAKFLALGINDAAGFYPDNTGTGFRVKIVERRGGSAQAPAIETSTDTPTFVKASLNSPRPAQAAKAIPIRDVIPTLCINGYEDIGQKRMIDGKAHELFRYLGNVCWGIINVVPPNRSEKPDQGDVFDGPQAPRPKGCGAGRDNKFALASFISVLGILMIRRRSRKAKRK